MLGPQGPEGDKGEHGINGKNGEDGEPGQGGDEGEPGADAEYCPCPNRNSPLFNAVKKESAKKVENTAVERKGGDGQQLRTQTLSSSQQYKRRFHKQ
ncbi:unnamed protein product [Meloidogyne enterolobii]|uniref:Uncharacterized protein n=1 Tax=Meloidogyne enterolobii TaxID=390850 RepID=A0ACB0YRI8_MELEN